MRAKNDVITRTDQSIGAAVETDKTKSIAACPIQGIGRRSFQDEHGIPITSAFRSWPLSSIPCRLTSRSPPPAAAPLARGARPDCGRNHAIQPPCPCSQRARGAAARTWRIRKTANDLCKRGLAGVCVQRDIRRAQAHGHGRPSPHGSLGTNAHRIIQAAKRCGCVCAPSLNDAPRTPISAQTQACMTGRALLAQKCESAEDLR